jgi:membrane protease YdiL (CAAX protease family)
MLACAAATLMALAQSGLDPSDEASGELSFDPRRPATLLVVLAAFFPMLAAPMLVLRVLHGVPWRLQWAPLGALRFGDFAKVGVAWMLAGALMMAVVYAVEPQQFAWRPLPEKYLAALLLAVPVILVQTTAEEVLFKGYLTRVIGAILPFALPVSVAMIGLFTAIHFENDEFVADFWFTIAAFIPATAISWLLFLRTGSLSGPAGWHFVKNVMTFLLIAPSHATLSQMSLVIYTDPWLAAGHANVTRPLSWALLVLSTAVFAVLIFAPRSPFYVPPATTPAPASAAEVGGVPPPPEPATQASAPQ